MAETGGEPWRFTAVDYATAVAGGGRWPRLTGAPAASRWDDALAGAMEATGIAVPEEQVLGEMIGDLATGGA